MEECNALAFKIFEQEMGIKPVMSAKDSVTLDNVDIKVWLHYLEQICEVFRGEIPHVKHPKLDYAEYKQKNKPNTMADFSRLHRLATSKHAEDLLTRNNRKPLEEGATSHVIGRVKKLGVENYPSEYNFEELHLQFLIKIRLNSLSESPSPQNQAADVPRRARKRRSYDKFGNIVSGDLSD